MNNLSIYGPEGSEGGYEIGILFPSFNEGVRPFHTLTKWFTTIEELEQNYRVLILILVNGKTKGAEGNDLTIKFGEILTGMIQHGDNPPEIIGRETNKLLDELQFLVFKYQHRLKIILSEYYHPNNTIGMARHKGCIKLIKQLSPSGIIVSTDTDTWPTKAIYLPKIMRMFEEDNTLGGVTGNFRCVLEQNSTDRTRQLDNYERICSSLYLTLICIPFHEERWDGIGNLSLMPGSNTIFRASLYGEKVHFSERLGTGEDMNFSRKLLEENQRIIYDPLISVNTIYRPSDRTEYGLGTELEAVNKNSEFTVMHPLIKIGHCSVHQIFEYVGDIEGVDEEWRVNFLIQCLRDEFGKEVIDASIAETIRSELKSGKGLLVGRVHLNDNAIRIVNDRLVQFFGRIEIKSAYEWIIQFIMERISFIQETNDGKFLYTVMNEELEKLRNFDTNIGNYEIFALEILEKIEIVLSSINRHSYQNDVIRLEPIPSP